MRLCPSRDVLVDQCQVRIQSIRFRVSCTQIKFSQEELYNLGWKKLIYGKTDLSKCWKGHWQVTDSVCMSPQEG